MRPRAVFDHGVCLQLQEQVVLFSTALTALKQENRVLQQRHQLLQRLLLEMDGLGWALTTPDTPASEDADDDTSLPSLASSSTVRSLLALQHTRVLLAQHGVELSVTDPAHRPLIVWMKRPAALRSEMRALTPAAARDWYRNRVCDAAIKLQLLRCDVAREAVEGQLETIMGTLCAWLLGLLLWRPDLLAELASRDLMTGASTSSAASPALWRQVADHLVLSPEQCTALGAAEELMGPRLSHMPLTLATLLQQHLLALAMDSPEAQDELIMGMQNALRSWHGTLVLQLLFCYTTLTPVQLATAAADAYPHFFCEGALTGALMVAAQRHLAAASKADAAAAAAQAAAAAAAAAPSAGGGPGRGTGGNKQPPPPQHPRRTSTVSTRATPQQQAPKSTGASTGIKQQQQQGLPPLHDQQQQQTMRPPAPPATGNHQQQPQQLLPGLSLGAGRQAAPGLVLQQQLLQQQQAVLQGQLLQQAKVAQTTARPSQHQQQHLLVR
jgi:hypothetical protein